MIRIDPNGDVEIEVIEMFEIKDSENRTQLREIRREKFLCRKEKLVEASDPFRAMFKKRQGFVDGQLIEYQENAVQLHNTHVNAMNIWLRAIHGLGWFNSPDVPLSTMWYLAREGDKYMLMNNLLRGWFEDWIRNHQSMLALHSQLIYPTWIFDHATEFARVTKALAYGQEGHIHEENPTRLRYIHLPARIIGSLNAARSHLRITLHKRLYKANQALLSSNCSSKEKLLFGWELALSRTGAWPLEQKYSHHSINDVIQKLWTFKYEPEPHQCRSCPRDFQQIVNDAIKITEENFDGLCLDCLDVAHPTKGNPVLGYQKSSGKIRYDAHCRIGHGESTCYYSFLARKEFTDCFKDQQESGRMKRKREDMDD